MSGHHGAPMPNITYGFDRTWGPQFYYFNKGDKDTTLAELRADAAQYASPEWNVDFYDSIAHHVPNYAPSSKRATFKGNIKLPKGAEKPIIVLSENKQDFQLNVFSTKSLQYWAEVDKSRRFTIPQVVEGTYRVTIYADGVFGWFIQDDVKISRSHNSKGFTWREDSAGVPKGVNFHVGKSDEAKDLNYVHWSFFPAKGNHLLSEPYYDNVNNWTITFDLNKNQLRARTATFTVQVAGMRSANGNAKWTPVKGGINDLPWTVNVNGAYESTWLIPYWRSGSYAVRSAVACQNVEHKFVFPSSKLRAGKNEFVLSLPFNASSVETAVLPDSLYVQYDALRLELK
ncbi:hypothetical protein B0J13DRAFT_662488 [Dactylonectria estremocensis]|uniref:rhamnogalacturonan endolyase n=1 Tax=Dactylonectria estremocensis TaxID=1079267 RepID=A0A9P9I6V5_9HYPO|nr:hypothetical protein B0J13DRAFT_662488 [Dactylonectria estremocensis]